MARNIETLAEAPYETGARVWRLWDGGTPVGLMAMVHPDEFLWHDPGDDRQAAYLWRLMIDARHQGKGFGRAAVNEALAVAREWGFPRLAASVADKSHSSIGILRTSGISLDREDRGGRKNNHNQRVTVLTGGGRMQ